MYECGYSPRECFFTHPRAMCMKCSNVRTPAEALAMSVPWETFEVEGQLATCLICGDGFGRNLGVEIGGPEIGISEDGIGRRKGADD